jgi:hypothetical protein
MTMSTISLKALRVLAPVTIVLVAGVLFATFAAAGGRGNDRANDRFENSDTAIAFRNDMRKLWEDHVTWTRLAIISIVDELPDQDASVGRLLQNQADIGDAIKPFYGDAAGDQLTALLHDHITTAAEILVAAKAGDAAGADEASQRWYANADDIAAFLNAANPDAWPLPHMQEMMREHLDLTLTEAQARLAGDYDADVTAYDEIHVQILGMADMLSLGIIDQFPKRFK